MFISETDDYVQTNSKKATFMNTIRTTYLNI